MFFNFLNTVILVYTTNDCKHAHHTARGSSDIYHHFSRFMYSTGTLFYKYARDYVNPTMYIHVSHVKVKFTMNDNRFEL